MSKSSNKADQQSIQYCTTMRAFFAFDELMDNLETRIRMWETERRKYMHDPNPETMTALTFAHDDWIAASKACLLYTSPSPRD